MSSKNLNNIVGLSGEDSFFDVCVKATKLSLSLNPSCTNTMLDESFTTWLKDGRITEKEYHELVDMFIKSNGKEKF